jgi:hypothetical protein
MYDALVMVDPEMDISAEQLASELELFYSPHDDKPRISCSDDSVTLSWPDYVLEVARSSLPHVLEESAEIAMRYASAHPEQSRISRAKIRFELSGRDDPDMLHFNDSLFIVEALERLGRVYRFDPVIGEFS